MKADNFETEDYLCEVRVEFGSNARVLNASFMFPENGNDVIRH